MNALVPQGKLKKHQKPDAGPSDRVKTSTKLEASGRRRVLGFILILFAVIILLPELNILSSTRFDQKQKARQAYIASLPKMQSWPEPPEMQTTAAVTATQVPQAQLDAFESEWVTAYVSASQAATPQEELEQPVNQLAPSDNISQSTAKAPVFEGDNPAAVKQVNAQSKPAKSAFMVQVATLSSKANADALVQQLRGLGYRAFIQRKEMYHQVIIGPQLRHSDAKLALANIEKDFSLQGIIKTYQLVQ